MNCLPTPEVTCGTTINDACVNITVPWPACFPQGGGPCYRQSEWNSASGSLICSIITTIGGVTDPLTLPAGVTSIIDSIDLSSLTACPSGAVPITPVGTTVAAELQNIYDTLCTYLPISLNTPLVLGPAPGLTLGCLQAPCGVPISTLGGLLQALINNACEGGGKVYRATLTQTGTSAPVATVLDNSLDVLGTELTWTYIGAGVYNLVASGSLSTIFQQNNTHILLGTPGAITDVFIAFRGNVNAIVVQTATGGVLTDALLNETSIEIRVY